MTDKEHAVAEAQSDVVVEKASFRWAHFINKEDSWAVWLGFALLTVGLLIFLPRPPQKAETIIAEANATMQAESQRAPFKTIQWHQAYDAKQRLKATSEPYAKTIARWLGRPHGWETNPIRSFVQTSNQAEAHTAARTDQLAAAEQTAAAAKAEAMAAEQAAAEANFNDVALNEFAVEKIRAWRDARSRASLIEKSATAKPYNQIPYLIGLSLILAVIFGFAMRFLRVPFRKFVVGFQFVFLIAVLSYMMAHQSTMNDYGIGYAAWAIVFGMVISNTVGTPHWVKPAVQTEFYIKTGLVLLGAEVLFGKIVAIGIPGLLVAWIVTPVVIISMFWLGNRYIKIESKSLNITIAAATSVCGVSAAIATAAASRAKKEELTLAVGMSLIFTAAMMIVMPNVIRAVGMDDVLGGAWMGGTIDSTGAVAAAGAFLSDRALYVAATVKMIQNILIGVVAFFVAIYWCLKVEVGDRSAVNAVELWYRLPKFVLGFVAASVAFSILYEWLGADTAYYAIDNGVLRGFSKTLRGWFFCLAFVSIGLESNFRDLTRHFTGGKPLILYVIGQSFNLILTLLVAYLAFFVIFPQITANI